MYLNEGEAGLSSGDEEDAEMGGERPNIKKDRNSTTSGTTVSLAIIKIGCC